MRGGTVADRLRGPRAIAARHRAALAARGRLRARRRPRRRRRAPRHQARQHAARRAAAGWPSADFGIARLALGGPADGDRPGARHRRLHLARAGLRRARDRRLGPLRARRRGLRAAGGGRAVRGREFAAQARPHVESPVPPAEGLPRGVDAVLARGLDKEPADRSPPRRRSSSRSCAARSRTSRPRRRRWRRRRRRRRRRHRGASGGRLRRPRPRHRPSASRSRRPFLIALAAIVFVLAAVIAAIAGGGGGSTRRTPPPRRRTPRPRSTRPSRSPRGHAGPDPGAGAAADPGQPPTTDKSALAAPGPQPASQQGNYNPAIDR